MNSSSDRITMSTRQKIMSCTMIFAITLQGMVFTLLTSFFPQQAFTKNMTHADVGVIFASFPAATLVVSVFGASLVNMFGTRLLYIVSCCVAVCTNILFAFVMSANSGWSFYIFCLIFRILQGVSYFIIQLSTFAIITNEMEHYLSTLMGLVEMSFGLGGCLGALIGGSLFDVNIILHEEDTNNKSPASIMLRIPELIFPFWTAAATTTAQLFTEAFMPSHLTDHFKMTTTVAGCYLMMLGIGSMILSPAFGYILDKKGFHEHVLIISSFMMGIGQLLLGPAPILGIMPSMPLALASIVIVGVCIPLLSVPRTAASFNITKELVGTLLGGVLINELNFARASMYMSLVSFMGVSNLITENNYKKR
ncbi:MFS-type transporter SLC18B1 [Nymphon striatum]|nr:MFS-type transporter SLC18B1 [Nymphon striatum]